MVKMTCTITTTLDKDVFALVVYSQDENYKWPIKLSQLVKDEWVFRNDYRSDVISQSLACGWFHDPGSEKHEKLAFCVRKKSNDSDWEIKLIDEVESGKTASCINTEGIDVYFIEAETGIGWSYHKAYDGEEYTKKPLGQPGDFAKVTELCAVSRWFGEPRLFGLSDGYLKEFQYNESRTHIVGTPITTARSGLSSLSATIEQDRHNSPETIRLTYFPDDQDIMGTYVWTQAEGWKPGPQIV
ncbi:uncharacterized protein BO87DRAFT_385203 [Aspergillus neoniger CBS 115656]|uniref:Fucose-specific lectin n=1 Tax=Aspergillus neoniger (strain CBS 115656) TaxID=1448310 RepID=A0A318YP90_ASPNB|nr:hypothetical protein BO87DRAFT_385203 [Aspergillus neoniger CBS 115656]PYH36134.1 hypothetical protein BO87DRAFT_385203 [Aspergillus neoniger CBS 115656]